MIFRVVLTPKDDRFRTRLARILWDIAGDELPVREGGATYTIRVPSDQAERFREALRKDVLPWGADVTESEE